MVREYTGGVGESTPDKWNWRIVEQMNRVGEWALAGVLRPGGVMRVEEAMRARTDRWDDLHFGTPGATLMWVDLLGEWLAGGG